MLDPHKFCGKLLYLILWITMGKFIAKMVPCSFEIKHDEWRVAELLKDINLYFVQTWSPPRVWIFLCSSV